MVNDYLTHAPAGLHGLRNILDKVHVSSSGDLVGLTWVEIYILSVAASPHPNAITHSNTACSHQSLALQLKEFTSASHGFLKFAVLSHFADLFHSPTSTHN
eukprot:64600-Karenia_brevis.AAC.1